MKNPTIQAIRAIASVALRRILSIATAIAIIFILLYVVIFVFLLRDSAWWVIGLVLTLPLIVVMCAVLIGTWVLSRYLRPRSLTKTETKSIQLFVSRLTELAELPGTPHFLIVFRLVRDAIGRRKNGFLASTIQNSGRLKSDFSKIRRFFE